MKTLEDAIRIILAEPPEPHYPAYYADLLSEADVSDKDDGKCSEIPNSSDTISRQVAIDAIELITWYHQNRNGEMVQGANSQEDQAWYKAEDVYKVLNDLPPAQPEKRTDKHTETHACVLIDRQAAVDTLYEAGLINYAATGDGNGMIQAINVIKGLPSAQPERKKGKWIVDALANNVYRCSECGTDAPVEPTGGTEYKSNYCPHCGADMRGETDED